MIYKLSQCLDNNNVDLKSICKENFEFWKKEYIESGINDEIDLENHYKKNAENIYIYMMNPPKCVGIIFIHDYTEETNVFMPGTMWFTLFVMSRYRGVNIAKKLMNMAFKDLIERKIKIVYISCKLELCKYYNNIGFIKFSNKNNNEVIMYKYLDGKNII